MWYNTEQMFDRPMWEEEFAIMESLIIWGGIALLVVLLSSSTFVLVVTGNWHWDSYVSRTSKLLWGMGFCLALIGALLWFGPAIVIGAWPFWLCVLGSTALVFGLLDLANGLGSSPRPSTSARSTAPDWDQLWRSYEGKPLPAWMLQAALQGEVRYDGKVARVVNGILVPTTRATPRLSLERVFSRLDDLLG